MKSVPTNHFRVLFVFAGFVLSALFVLWIVGGRDSIHTVEVTSNLELSVLKDRFDQRLDNLQYLDSSLVQFESLRKYRTFEVSVPISVLGQFPSGVSFPLSIPLADIVFSDIDTNVPVTDPAVVFMETEFRASNDLTLEWYARDSNAVYLREMDPWQHVRLIKLNTGNLEFAEASGSGVRSVVRYTFVTRHTGLQRLYGKFFDRNCENSAITRLQWLCQELESVE